MFLSGGLPSAVLSSSATKKSLYWLHTHSGYSAVKKNIRVENERALVGTRTRSFNIAESFAWVSIEGTMFEHEAGNMPPFDATQSFGAATAVLMFFPLSNE